MIKIRRHLNEGEAAQPAQLGQQLQAAQPAQLGQQLQAAQQGQQLQAAQQGQQPAAQQGQLGQQLQAAQQAPANDYAAISKAASTYLMNLVNNIKKAATPAEMVKSIPGLDKLNSDQVLGEATKALSDAATALSKEPLKEDSNPDAYKAAGEQIVAFLSSYSLFITTAAQAVQTAALGEQQAALGEQQAALPAQ